MCQSIIQIYACGCEGAVLKSKCYSPTPRCSTLLRHPTPLNMPDPCDAHAGHEDLLSHVRDTRPPSAYYNNRKNPEPRPQTATELPTVAWNSSQRSQRRSRRGSGPVPPPKDTADSAQAREHEIASSRPKGPATSLPTRTASLGTHPYYRRYQQAVENASVANQRPKISRHPTTGSSRPDPKQVRFQVTDQKPTTGNQKPAFTQYTIISNPRGEEARPQTAEEPDEFKQAAMRVRRSLDERRRQALDEEDVPPQVPEKDDRSRGAAYQRKKTDPRNGQRPGPMESLKQKTKRMFGIL